MSAEYNDAAKRLQALRSGIVSELWENPRYKHLIQELRSRRPTVPYWKPSYLDVKRGIVIPDNTPEMQSASAAQKWHDVMMAIIDPERYPQGQGGE